MKAAVTARAIKARFDQEKINDGDKYQRRQPSGIDSGDPINQVIGKSIAGIFGLLHQGVGDQKSGQQKENANAEVLHRRNVRTAQPIDLEERDRVEDANQLGGENAQQVQRKGSVVIR